MADGTLQPVMLAVLVLTPLALHEVLSTLTQAAQSATRAHRAPAQSSATRTSASQPSQVASPKSPALSPVPKRSNTSVPRPCSTKARAWSATMRRLLFISSANAGQWTTMARGSPANGGWYSAKSGPPRPSRKKGCISGGLPRDELREAAHGPEYVRVQLIVVRDEPETLL